MSKNTPLVLGLIAGISVPALGSASISGDYQKVVEARSTNVVMPSRAISPVIESAQEGQGPSLSHRSHSSHGSHGSHASHRSHSSFSPRF